MGSSAPTASRMTWKSSFHALAAFRVPVTAPLILCPQVAPPAQLPAVRAVNPFNRHIRFKREDLQDLEALPFLWGLCGLCGLRIRVGYFPKADLRSGKKPNSHPDSIPLRCKTASSVYGKAGRTENNPSLMISKIGHEKPSADSLP